MARKINSTNLRVGNRIIGEPRMSVKTTNYAQSLFKIESKKEYLQKIAQSMRFLTDNILIASTNKSSKAFIKTLDPKFMLREYVKFAEKKKLLNLLLQGNFLNVSNFYRESYQTYDRTGEKNTNNTIIIPFFKASTLCNFIVNQIVEPRNKKDHFYKKSLKKGIAESLALLLSNPTQWKKPLISGIRVEVTGRWTQTQSGRSQKNCFTVGKINRQFIKKYISFGSSTAVTKYGSCTVKVWICFETFFY